MLILISWISQQKSITETDQQCAAPLSSQGGKQNYKLINELGFDSKGPVSYQIQYYKSSKQEKTMEEGKKKSPMKLRDLGHYKWVSKGKGANKLKILFMSLQSKVL